MKSMKHLSTKCQGTRDRTLKGNSEQMQTLKTEKVERMNKKETLEAKVTTITNNPADLVNPDTKPDAASSSNESNLKGFVFFVLFIIVVIFGILALIWWGIGGICNACGCKETAQGCWSSGETCFNRCGSCIDLLYVLKQKLHNNQLLKKT